MKYQKVNEMNGNERLNGKLKSRLLYNLFIYVFIIVAAASNWLQDAVSDLGHRYVLQNSQTMTKHERKNKRKNIICPWQDSNPCHQLLL